MFISIEDVMLRKVYIRASEVAAIREGVGMQEGKTHIILSSGEAFTTSINFQTVCLMVEHGYESPI